MFTIGSKILAQYSDGQWYEATISQISGQEYFVQYDDGLTAWLPTTQIRPLVIKGNDAISVGMRVQAQWNDGGWYAATISQINADKYYVTFDDGFSACLQYHQIQPMMLSPGMRVMAQWTDESWYPGTITEIGGDTYFIQFDDGASSWLASPQVKPM